MFCTRTVNWFLKKDKLKWLTAIPIQDFEGRLLLRERGIVFVNLNTIYFIDNNKVYTKAKAVFKILKYLSFPTKLLLLFSILPYKFCDKCYDIIAKNRYSIIKK